MNRGIELLRFNHAGAMLLKDGNTVNYGVIRIENEELIYYTGKGLREMWSPNLTDQEKIRAEELKKLSEKQLIDSGHITITPMEQIERVIF